MRKEIYDVAVVALHPIQYQAGLWRGMAQHPRFRVDVLFLDRIGVDGSLDPTLNAPMKWDVPLLDGYPSEFVRNLSPFRFSPLVNRVNPGLYKRLCARPYDAILVHGYLVFSNWIAMLAAKRRGTRLVYRGEGSLRGRTLHDSAVVNLLKYPVHGFFLGQCDVIACSSNDNREYHLHRGAPADRLFLMPCAVDNETLEDLRNRAAPPEEFRRRHGLPQATRVVLTVGRFFENKCIDDLIASFAEPELRDRSDLHLALVGDGPLRTDLERQVRELGLEERVSFLGFLNQSEVAEAMLASNVFALTSNRDPSPKALSEALYLGLPVVCSDGIGTCQDLVEVGGNGEVFPCYDVPALAASLARVVDDDGRMGRRSHEIALANDFRVGLDALARKLDETPGDRP